MKIAVINGSPRKGITYQCINVVKEEMQKCGNVGFEEINLPQDAPCFCKGCFTCFERGPEHCPNAEYIGPIVKKLEDADGLIIGTPVYVMQLTGALKALFDQMAYCYLNHKPRFFRKKAFVVVTTAGAGVSNCINYIKQNLAFWGISNIITFGKAMNAAQLKQVPDNIMNKAQAELRNKARKFYKETASKKLPKAGFLQSLMFCMSRALSKSQSADNDDRKYWEKQGWYREGVKYYVEGVRPHFFGRLVGLLAAKVMFRNIIKEEHR